MADKKLSAKRGLKMDTHIRRLLIIMVCWFVFMGIMKGRKFYSVVNFQTMFAQFPEFGLMSLGVMVCMISSGIDLSTVGVANMTSITMALLMRRIANGGSELSPVWILPIFALALLIGAAAGLLNGVLIRAAVRFLLRVHAPDGAACSADVSASGAAAACAASGGHASSANLASCDRRREFQLPENGRPCAFFRKARPAYGGNPDRDFCLRALRARPVPGSTGRCSAAADGFRMARSSGAATGS